MKIRKGKRSLAALQNAAEEIMHVGDSEEGMIAVLEKEQGTANPHLWGSTWTADGYWTSHETWDEAVKHIVNHLDSRSALARYKVEQLQEDGDASGLRIMEVERKDPDGMDPNLTIKTVKALSRML